MNDRFVQALALGLDPAWRRLPAAERRDSCAEFFTAVESGEAVTTFTYSMVGLKPGIDVLLWRLGSGLDALEESAAAALRIEAGVNRLQREETADHQAGADQQHESQRELRRHQETAHAIALNAVAVAYSLLNPPDPWSWHH